MAMKIRNAKGTAQATCPCPSWLRHWERHSGQTTRYCGAVRCLRTDVVGAHVQRSGVWDSKVYIYPLCTKCNQQAGELEVSDALALVDAAARFYCGS